MNKFNNCVLAIYSKHYGIYVRCKYNKKKKNEIKRPYVHGNFFFCLFVFPQIPAYASNRRFTGE